MTTQFNCHMCETMVTGDMREHFSETHTVEDMFETRPPMHVHTEDE